jgi:hypothetical protein
MRRFAWSVAALFVLAAGTGPARADTIGPGQVQVGAGDSAFNLLAVDLNKPATLAAGSYLASSFNY